MRLDVDEPDTRLTETFEAFRMVHLATAAERALYRLFARDPAGSWSDAEIAFATRLGLEDVRWAVQRFADAGIVDVADDGCCRWRPELRYVFQGEEPTARCTDPVCLMPVGDATRLRAEDVFGRTERFCSERCMATFILWPILFTRPLTAEHDGRREDLRAR